MLKQTVSFGVVRLLLLSGCSLMWLAQASSGAMVTDAATEVAEVFESLADVSADDFKEVRRLAGQTVGLRDTGEFNTGVRMLRREDIREQQAKLTAAIATEKWVDGFVMALQLMAACGG